MAGWKDSSQRMIASTVSSVVKLLDMDGEPPTITLPRSSDEEGSVSLFLFLVSPSESSSSELFFHMDLGGRERRFTN